MFNKVKIAGKHILKEESGATVTEYALLLGILGLAGSIVVLSPFGQVIEDTLTKLQTDFSSFLT